jgi:hypothetical protein
MFYIGLLALTVAEGLLLAFIVIMLSLSSIMEGYKK